MTIRPTLRGLHGSPAVPGSEDSPERGSIGVLAIGLVILLLLVTITVTAVSSVYVEQRRLQLLADECADAATSQVTGLQDQDGARPRVVLSEQSVTGTAVRVLDEVPHSIDAVSVAQPTGLRDGSTAQVTLRATAHPPLVGFFLPEGVEISATSSSRVTVLP